MDYTKGPVYRARIRDGRLTVERVYVDPAVLVDVEVSGRDEADEVLEREGWERGTSWHHLPNEPEGPMDHAVLRTPDAQP